MSIGQRKERHKNVPSSYLVLFKDNKTLLLRRQNTGFEDGNYGLVAGHVDEGETFTQAVIREIYEEAGIILKPQDLKVAHVMHRKSTGIDNERVDAFFVTRHWEGEITNKEPQKCDDLSWFDLDNLPANTIPYIRQAIEKIKEGVFYSEYGWEK